MAHDDYLRGVHDELAHGVCHDAGLDLRPSLDGHGATAVKLEVQAVLDDGLVAAARERHLYTERGVLEALLEGLGVLPYAYAYRRGNARGSRHLADAVEYGELVVYEFLQILLLEDEDVSVAVVLGEIPADARSPDVYPIVDIRKERGLDRVGRVAEKLVVVIEHDYAHHGARCEVCILYGLEIGHVYPVHDAEVISRALLARADEIAVDAVAAPAELDRFGTSLVPVRQPLRRKARDHLVDADLEKVLSVAGYAQKLLVRPDYLSVSDVEYDHGERHIHKCVGGGGVPRKEDGLDVREHLALALAEPPAGIEQQQDDEKKLAADENPDVEAEHSRGYRRGDEYYQHDKIHPHGRPENSREFIAVQRAHLPCDRLDILLYQILIIYTTGFSKFACRNNHFYLRKKAFPPPKANGEKPIGR